jgi:hypothetical protein
MKTMMTAERWQQVQKLFLVAVEQPHSERVAFLEQACAGDTSLCQEVQSLIEMHESSDHVLDKSVGVVAAKLLAKEKDETLAGQSIGHYKIEHEIGRGGMGEVYLARDTRLNRQVAIKLLPASFINDPERVRRFQQEARAASALNHPNIVTIYEVGESERLRFIVSEFVEGKTLRELLRDGRIRAELAVDIIIQAATALCEGAGFRACKTDRVRAGIRQPWPGKKLRGSVAIDYGCRNHHRHGTLYEP